MADYRRTRFEGLLTSIMKFISSLTLTACNFKLNNLNYLESNEGLPQM